jgi:hypothetical protein
MEQHLQQSGAEQEPTLQAASSEIVVSQQAYIDQSAEIDRLLAVIARERKGRWWRVICRGYLTFFILAIIAFAITKKLGYASLFSMIGGPLFVMSFPVGFTAWATRRQKEAAVKLAQIDDVRVIGAVLDARFYIDKKLQGLIVPTLIRLLHRLKASDAHLLTDTQKKMLHKWLPVEKIIRPEEKFVLAVLKALEQVGTPEALPYVEKLAEGKGMATTNATVREAAQDCLLYLRERLTQQEANQTLLRPGNAPTDTLLRPVEDHHEIKPQQLLRSSTPEDT